MALEHEYELPPAELFAAVTDPDYLAARNARFGGVGTPQVDDVDDTVVVRISRQLPADKVPGPVRPFLGDGVIVLVDTWTPPADDASPVTATWRADVANAPAQLGGEHLIEPTDDGSRYTITVDVSIKIPFVGRKLEQQVAGYLDSLISKELDYLAEWISENR